MILADATILLRALRTTLDGLPLVFVFGAFLTPTP
jgi:hypothetical protein